MIKVKLKHATVHERLARQAMREFCDERLAQMAGLVVVDTKNTMVKAPIPGEPSAPGTPPHIQTQRLHDSVHAQEDEAAKTSARRVAYVIANPEDPDTKFHYAAVHEHGGMRHPRRPYLGPALRRMSRMFPQLFHSGTKLHETKTGRMLNMMYHGKANP